MTAPACPWRLRASTIDVDCMLGDDHLGDRVEHWHRNDEGWSVEWTDTTTGAYRYPLSTGDPVFDARHAAHTLRRLPDLLRDVRKRRELSQDEAALRDVAHQARELLAVLDTRPYIPYADRDDTDELRDALARLDKVRAP